MELMVTLAVAAAVFGLGVPAFREFGKNGRLTGAANEMLVTLMTARNEAVRRQVRPSFCPSSTPDADLAICELDATQGYIAFVDKNKCVACRLCESVCDKDAIVVPDAPTQLKTYLPDFVVTGTGR